MFTVFTIVSKIPFPILIQRKFTVVGGRFYRCQVMIWPPKHSWVAARPVSAVWGLR